MINKPKRKIHWSWSWIEMQIRDKKKLNGLFGFAHIHY